MPVGPPSRGDKVWQVTPKRGRTGGRSLTGTPTLLSIRLLGGGSLCGLVRRLTVLPCVPLSTVRGGWICG